MKRILSQLESTCPVCKHSWVVRHDKEFLGGIFIRTDFAIAMFDHLQSHTSLSENLVKAYEYNQGVDVK